MSVSEKINDYLTEAKVYYLCTEDGKQPKCRPMGFHKLENDTVYFGIGTFKDCYKQMVENPLVEIVACKGGGWLRFYGKAVFEKDSKMADAVIAASPMLSKIYNDETGYKFGVFHLEEATAEFRGMMDIQESFKL